MNTLRFRDETYLRILLKAILIYIFIGHDVHVHVDILFIININNF